MYTSLPINHFNVLTFSICVVLKLIHIFLYFILVFLHKTFKTVAYIAYSVVLVVVGALSLALRVLDSTLCQCAIVYI